jgi:hypothetical protein
MPNACPRAATRLPAAFAHLAIDTRKFSRHREHQRERMFGHCNSVDTRRIAYGHAMLGCGREVNVVRAGAPYGHHLERRTTREYRACKPGMRAYVDGDPGVGDAPYELRLIVGPTFRMDPDRAKFMRTGVRRRSFEDGRIIVRHDDHVNLPLLFLCG